MAEVIGDDILEKIFIRMDVKDIFRCKKVCKSWYSFISSSRFVYSHMKLNNSIVNSRRRIVAFAPYPEKALYILGSHNGLVCLLTYNKKICVVNPCTREVNRVDDNYQVFKDILFPSYLGGFGYDSCSDDYKVILGKRDYKEDNLMPFYVLSLKSNAWKRVGEVRFVHRDSGSGILCNGALHWLMRDPKDNTNIILSFDLSKEKFKVSPMPAHTIEDGFDLIYGLGIIEECLCIYYKYHASPKWVMKNYNDNESWELVPHCRQWDDEVTHYLKILSLKTYNRTKNFFHHDERLVRTQEYISAPVFVRSLVSPHVNKR